MGGELHLLENVPPDVDALGDLDQREPLRLHLEDGALGKELGGLPALDHAGAHRVGDVVGAGDQLPHRSLPHDGQAAIGDSAVQAAGGEGAGKHQVPRIMRNVDEAAGARIAGAEPADIHIARRVELGEGERGERAVSTVNEIELLQAIEQRFRPHVGRELPAAHHHAAERAVLGGELVVVDGAVVEQAVLGHHQWRI